MPGILGEQLLSNPLAVSQPDTIFKPQVLQGIKIFLEFLVKKEKKKRKKKRNLGLKRIKRGFNIVLQC